MHPHSSSVWRLQRHADHAGAAMSVLCAVHCLAVPLLAGFYPTLLRLLPGDDLLHRTLAVLIVLAGAFAFIPGYREHRKPAPALLALLGLAATLTVAWFGDRLPRAVEFSLSIPGSMLLVAAHLANHTFCRRCRACASSTTCAALDA